MCRHRPNIRLKALDEPLRFLNLRREIFHQFIFQSVLLALMVCFQHFQSCNIYIQFPLFLGNRVLQVIVQLIVDQFLHNGAKLHHAFDPAGGCRRKVSLSHDAVLTEVNIPIHHCVGEVLYIGVCRNSFALQGQLFLRCQLLCFIMTANVLHSLM